MVLQVLILIISLQNNKTLTITNGGGAGTAGQVLTSTGYGIQW